MPTRRRPLSTATRSTSVALLLLAALCLQLAVVAPAEAAGIESYEDQLVDLMNAERRSRGLPALRAENQLVGAAREHTALMVGRNDLFHAGSLLSRVTTVGGRALWAGENVGYGGSIQRLHDNFMASGGHRANVLSRATHVGVGAKVGRGGTIWVTVRFVQLQAGAQLPTFADTASSQFRPSIEDVWDAEVTKGCNPPYNSRYCPGKGVTRAEMAVFLVRALDLPARSSRPFRDVPSGHWAAADIAALAAAGITAGCNPPANDRFCPDAGVSRAQMAAFLVRGANLPAGRAGTFSDVPRSHWASADIDALARSGVTNGCNPPANTRYCPDSRVTREQMAAFLVRGFDL